MKRILTIIICAFLFFMIGSFAFMSFKTTYDEHSTYNFRMFDTNSLRSHESFDVRGNVSILANLENTNDMKIPAMSESFESFSDDIIKNNHLYIDATFLYENENINSGVINRGGIFVFNDKIVGDFDNYFSYDEVDGLNYRFYEMTPKIIENADSNLFFNQSFKLKNPKNSDYINSSTLRFSDAYFTTEEAEELLSAFLHPTVGFKLYLYPHPLFENSYLIKESANSLGWRFIGFRKLDTPVEFYNLSGGESIIDNDTCNEFKDLYTYQIFEIGTSYSTGKGNIFSELFLSANDKNLFIDKNEFKTLVDSIQFKE